MLNLVLIALCILPVPFEEVQQNEFCPLLPDNRVDEMRMCTGLHFEQAVLVGKTHFTKNGCQWTIETPVALASH